MCADTLIPLLPSIIKTKKSRGELTDTLATSKSLTMRDGKNIQNQVRLITVRPATVTFFFQNQIKYSRHSFILFNNKHMINDVRYLG